jgi:enoyl-CoA hydratase
VGVACRRALPPRIRPGTDHTATHSIHQLATRCRSSISSVTVATRTPADCLDRYAFTKRAGQAAALRDIAALADPLDEELPDGMISHDARHAHRRYWQQLKGPPATW